MTPGNAPWSTTTTPHERDDLSELESDLDLELDPMSMESASPTRSPKPHGRPPLHPPIHPDRSFGSDDLDHDTGSVGTNGSKNTFVP